MKHISQTTKIQYETAFATPDQRPQPPPDSHHPIKDRYRCLVRIRNRRSPRQLLQPRALLAHILGYLLRFLALHGLARGLYLQDVAVCVCALAAGEGVHGFLEGVVFPAEEVVTVLAVAGAVGSLC